MAEERVVFRGHPSIATVFGSLFLSIVLLVAIAVGLSFFWNSLPTGNMRYAACALFLIPLLILLSKVVQLKLLLYEITSERIKVTHGLLTRRTDELELYRVKDTSLIEPFFYRLFSAANIFIATNDASTPKLELRGVKNAKDVREQLRQSVEECRMRKGAQVREME
ncbi:MAG: hypothetical protein JWM68_2238 [Verrucomicrobiales bacterium]|nr:hypothetical protein [Verrucomicrobiales bacterium]